MPAAVLFAACGTSKEPVLSDVRIGHCAYTGPQSRLEECKDYLGAWKVEDAQKDCTDLKGTFEGISAQHFDGALNWDSIEDQTRASVTFLKVIPGTFPISLRMIEGFVAPLFTTAVGTAILSQLPDTEIADMVARANSRARRRIERVDLDYVMQNVRHAQQKGFAVLYDAVFPDTGAIAVPFPSPVEGFPMAIGVGGLRDRMRRNEKSIYRTLHESMVRHLGRNYRKLTNVIVTERAAGRGVA
jgi:hypothetical protein